MGSSVIHRPAEGAQATRPVSPWQVCGAGQQSPCRAVLGSPRSQPQPAPGQQVPEGVSLFQFHGVGLGEDTLVEGAG